MEIPSSASRVPEHTSACVNETIREITLRNIARTSGDDAIERRLDELDHEWDVERTLEANAATLMVVGSVLGATVDRKWLLLPIAVGGFLLQHAIQGWCPPLPVLRRLGFRTVREIDEERFALKAKRGDFHETGSNEIDDRELYERVVRG